MDADLTCGKTIRKSITPKTKNKKGRAAEIIIPAAKLLMEQTNNIFMPNIINETSTGTNQISLSTELFRHRKIYLIDEINAESMAVLMQSLMYLDSISCEPIELYINSPGGHVSSGMAVYRYMTQMQSPIHTYCIGIAASMGAILYLAGTQRFAYEGTKIVIHDPSSVAQTYEKPGELKGRLESLEKTKDMICHIIADRTGHTKDEIAEIIMNDRIYEADEAKSFGLATHIIQKEAEDYHNNPFVSKPDGNRDTNRGLPPPIERYSDKSGWNPSPDDIIIPSVPKSLLHIHHKDNITYFRFGFSYSFSDDGRTVYANTDIKPSQTKFENFRYNLNLGSAKKKYECELSDGSGTIVLTAEEIARLYTDSRNKYLANKVRRSALANR